MEFEHIQKELESSGLEVLEKENEINQISSEFEIKLNEIDKDGTDETVEIVTTDKEVPEATKSDIRLYAADKGRTIEFQTAPSGR